MSGRIRTRSPRGSLRASSPEPGEDLPGVHVRDLRVRRGGREVLHGLTLEISRGQVTGLLGPSGCGKTTLMRTVVGVQVIESGEVEVLGRPAGSRELRRKIGYSPQDPAIYQDLSVAENLRYFSTVLGVPGTDIGRVLGEVGLAEAGNQPGGTLSGGQLSRAGLAVALLGTPEVLVLDEPTVGLDPILRRDLWSLFRRLAASGVTLLVSSHVMDEAARCDRLLLMREGEILADDTPDGLRERTRTADLDEAFLHLIEARGLEDPTQRP